MTTGEHAWIWIAHVRNVDDTVTAGFVVDERRYADPATAQAVVDEASEELQRHGLAYEFENVRVRPDEPAPDLPTWTEYRRRLPGAAGGGGAG